MADRYDEQLILGHVEADLTPQQAETFRQMMADDPRLDALVGQMIADRQALRESPRKKAPGELIDRLTPLLERDMLLGGSSDLDSSEVDVSRWRIGRWAAYGALAAVLVLSTLLIVSPLLNGDFSIRPTRTKLADSRGDAAQSGLPTTVDGDLALRTEDRQIAMPSLDQAEPSPVSGAGVPTGADVPTSIENERYAQASRKRLALGGVPAGQETDLTGGSERKSGSGGLAGRGAADADASRTSESRADATQKGASGGWLGELAIRDRQDENRHRQSGAIESPQDSPDPSVASSLPAPAPGTPAAPGGGPGRPAAAESPTPAGTVAGDMSGSGVDNVGASVEEVTKAPNATEINAGDGARNDRGASGTGEIGDEKEQAQTPPDLPPVAPDTPETPEAPEASKPSESTAPTEAGQTVAEEVKNPQGTDSGAKRDGGQGGKTIDKPSDDQPLGMVHSAVIDLYTRDVEASRSGIMDWVAKNRRQKRARGNEPVGMVQMPRPTDQQAAINSLDELESASSEITQETIALMIYASEVEDLLVNLDRKSWQSAKLRSASWAQKKDGASASSAGSGEGKGKGKSAEEGSGAIMEAGDRQVRVILQIREGRPEGQP